MIHNDEFVMAISAMPGELRKCPFCSEDHPSYIMYRMPAGVRFGVACGKCGCIKYSGVCQSKAQARREWNGRTEADRDVTDN